MIERCIRGVDVDEEQLATCLGRDKNGGKGMNHLLVAQRQKYAPEDPKQMVERRVFQMEMA